MYDLKFIRENETLLRDTVRKKGEKADIDRLMELDERRRALLGEVEQLKAERNSQSQEIGRKKAAGEDAQDAIRAMRDVGDRIKAFDQELSDLLPQMNELISWIPNVPHGSVPEGDESCNRLVREWGTPRREDGLMNHVDLGTLLGVLDLPAGSKMSGYGFAILTGAGARLQRALINFMVDRHTAHGYREVRIPYATRAEALFGCGQLPKLEEDMYRIPLDELYLIPTAEVPLTNLMQGQELRAEDLPVQFVAYSPCFRREAGTYGKDTRGLIRVHQFDKVEMVKLVEPSTSYDALESLTGDAEAILQALELPYRVLELATGDLSFAAAKCYDLELWAPGEQRWLEVSSCSNFEAFQARRIGLRYRNAQGKKDYVHTLNGSGVALPRLIVAILEHYQTPERSVRIPEVLRPYMGGIAEIRGPQAPA